MTKFVPDDQLETYKQAASLWDALHDTPRAMSDMFVGSAVDVGMSLGLSRGRVSYLITLLSRAGNLTMLRRGSRKGPSQYKLGPRPEASAIRATMRDMYHAERLARPSKTSAISDGLAALAERVTRVEERLDALEGIEE